MVEKRRSHIGITQRKSFKNTGNWKKREAYIVMPKLI